MSAPGTASACLSKLRKMSNISGSVIASELWAVLLTISIGRRDQIQLGQLSKNIRCSKGPGSVSCKSCPLGISYEETSWRDSSSSCSSKPPLMLSSLWTV